MTIAGPQRVRQALGTVATLGTSEVLGKVATLVMFVVLARTLDVADMGLFAYGLGVGLLLAVAASLGLESVMVQVVSRDRARADGMLASVLRLRVLLSVVVLLLATVVMLTRPGVEARLTILLLVGAALLDTFTDAFRGVCTALQQQRHTAQVLVQQRVIQLLTTVGMAVIWRSPLAAACGYTVAALLGVLLMARAAAQAGAAPRWSARAPEDDRALTRPIRVVGTNAVVSMALFRVDVLLIGMLLGDAAVGVYSTSYRLLETVLFLSWSITRVVTPMVGAAGTELVEVRRHYRLGVSLLLAAFLPYAMTLAVRGHDLVQLLFGEPYAVRGLTAALALAPLFFGLSHLAGLVLLARRPDPVVLLASATALTANVALNLALIPAWGVIGAGVATTLSYAVQACVTGVSLRRLLGPSGMGRSLVVASSASCLAGLAMLLPLHVLIALPLAAATYLLSWWLLTRAIDPHQAARLVDLRG